MSHPYNKNYFSPLTFFLRGEDFLVSVIVR